MEINPLICRARPYYINWKNYKDFFLHSYISDYENSHFNSYYYFNKVRYALEVFLFNWRLFYKKKS